MSFVNSILTPVLVWLPNVFFGVVIILAILFYLSTLKNPESPKPYFKRLAWWTVGFKLLYAAILTIGQYFIWNGDQFGKIFLSQPLKIPNGVSPLEHLPLFSSSKLGYFLFYSWGHFWLNALVSIALALVFWAFLKALQKKEARYFYKGETELGLVLTLAVGWPNFVVFIPLTFLMVVLVSLFRTIFIKESYTTLGWPLILAAIIAFALGQAILGNFDWEFLKISLGILPVLG